MDTAGSDDDAGPGTVRRKSPENFRPSASHTACCTRALGRRARGKGHRVADRPGPRP